MASIMDDDDVTLETVLEDGLHVQTVLEDPLLSAYPLRKDSTLLHWTAAYDAQKCAKVSRQHHQGRMHFSLHCPLTLCDMHLHVHLCCAGAPETRCEG